jgi:hypothetical protein
MFSSGAVMPKQPHSPPASRGSNRAPDCQRLVLYNVSRDSYEALLAAFGERNIHLS